MFWFSLQLLSETFPILRIIQRDIVINVKTSSRKLSNLNETWVPSTDFRKILKYKISWQSVRCEPSCSLWTTRWTGMTRLGIAFWNFANAPKNAWSHAFVRQMTSRCDDQLNTCLHAGNYNCIFVWKFQGNGMRVNGGGGGGAETSEAWLPGKQNFVRWGLTFSAQWLWFSLRTKMCINSHAASRCQITTVRFAGQSSIVDPQ